MTLKDKIFYGWIMVAAFFISGTILAGVQFSFGVFFKSIEVEFAISRVVTSLIPSISMLIGSFFRILGGWAIDRYGPKKILFLMGLFTGLSLILTSQTQALWQILITYSLILPIGTSATFTVSMSTISRWFERRRGLALGIAGSGPGLGMIVIAPLATFLISTLDWRTAYIVMGLIAWLLVIPLSFLLKRDPHSIGALPDGTKLSSQLGQKSLPNSEHIKKPQEGLSLPQSLRTKSFWSFILIWVTFGFTIFFISTHMVPHVTDLGFSPLEAASILSLIGVAVLVGRIIFGIISDRFGRKGSLILCAVIRAAMLLCLIWVDQLWVFYLFALVYGLTTGGFSPIMAALISETFGLRRIGAIIGALDIGFGIGAAIGPAIGGFIFDVTESYFIAFIIGAILMLIAIPLILQIRQEMLDKKGTIN
jgi:MFS family permease